MQIYAEVSVQICSRFFSLLLNNSKADEKNINKFSINPLLIGSHSVCLNNH